MRIKDDEDVLLDEQEWTIDDLWPSASDNIRLSERSPFDGVKIACAAVGFRVPTDVFGAHLLAHQDEKAIVDLPSSDAARV